MQRRDAPDDPASLPGRGASERVEEPVSIEGPPPLARMAAIAALIDLIWNRIIVRVLANSDQETAVALQRWGVFPRNLAAVAGLIALTAALFTFMRMARYSSLVWRLAVASIAGIVLPTFIVALVKPKEEVHVLVVVAALLGSNLLAVLVGGVAVRYAAGARRWASAVATASGAFVMAVLVASYVRSVAASPVATPISIIAHYGGEIAWHLLPLVVLVAMARTQPGAPPSDGVPPRIATWGGAIAVFVLAATAAGLYAQSVLHARHFATLVYAALRLTLVPPAFAWLNATTLGIGLAAAIYGLASRHPGRAQLGAAVALWVAAGCSPHAPGQLLDFALATVLLARSTQAVTPEGRARARVPWTPIPTAAVDPGLR